MVITIGRYVLGICSDPGRFTGDGKPTLIRILHRKDVAFKTVDVGLDSDNAIVIETAYEPHYWFDMRSHFDENGDLSEDLEKRIFGYHEDVLSVASLSEGVASGVLPPLLSYLRREGKSAASIVVFPSMVHSSDALFNAFSTVGLVSMDALGPLILLDQSCLEAFVGVRRDGGVLMGSGVIDYLVELFLGKDGFIRDLAKLSRSFGVGIFTVLMAAGCSLKIYESFRNILDITLEQPMLDLDLSTASMVYAIVRAPLHLRGELTKGRIELEVASWLKERADLDAPQICDPVYVEEFGDKIDIVILVGGLDMRGLFASIDSRISRFSRIMVEQELYDREAWIEIRRQLLGS
ncbi:hypothetical protein AC482_04285 [miscellaneous Crenarchaeota group-15 archaeon DG-45]|uniref:Uncharacterized protein n=1 Tax=miscellaneous Crenarchaeota group-15 archaeon DG-45 TaxID=1685127 RepID=A0A0M0BPP3_9ARCH|nr:MAG: hypothetical protein AC482_04285 [miscellaneous Crenarchaeota group-15 archaeon DG-45]